MYRSLMLVLLGLWVAGSAFAADTESSTVVMDEVVVTAGRVVEKVKDQTMSVTVINAEEIAASPSRDLGDLLAEKGIGYIQKYPGALTTVSIRGFKTNAQASDLLGDSLVLLNGRRAGTGNVAMIMTRDIERVEIVRGPGAVQYGSAAVGGVINIITRQGDGPVSGEVFGSLGSYDFAEGGALLSGDAGQFDYSLGFARSTMNDYKTANGDRYRNTGFDAKQSYSVNLGYSFLDSHRLGVMLNTTEVDKTGTPNYLSMNDLDDYRDSDYQAIDVSYTGETGDRFLAWELRYFETDIEDKSYDFGGYFGDSLYETKVDQKGGQAQLSTDLASVHLVSGVDWSDYEVKSTFAPNRSTYESMAGFVLTKSRFLDDRLIVDAGLRYEYFEVEVTRPKGNSEDDYNLISSFGLAYLLNDQLKVRAHYGEAFKMPGADQLAADYNAYGYRYVGNPDLDSETSRTYEGGIEYVDQALSASLGYFYTRFKDKITSVNLGSSWSWENTGKAEISGVEAEVSSDFALMGMEDLRLQPYLNFTYFDRYRDLDKDEDLKYMNEMNASYGVGLKMPYDLSARLNFAYHGRKWVDDWETGMGEDVEKGGFTVADLSLNKELFDSSCSIGASVGNLFDKDYAYVLGYPMPGRNYQVNMSYRF
jgi:vitamin B12 transporter